MTSVAAASLAGVLAPAEPRQPEPAQNAAEPQGAAFASLLAALVAPAPAITLATPAPTVDGVSELDVEEQNAAEPENAGDATAATLASATGVAARREPRDDANDDDADSTSDDASAPLAVATPAAPVTAASLIDASRAMAATVAASLEPVKSPDALDPEFREKLGRVVSRMRELGHEVRVVETVRSQARQEKLFAQGRTAPGPVVTWTRNSNHTQGRAADVTIDGRYDGEGFQTLQRVAREEGLHTLGARDPGHLELKKATSVPDASRGASMRQAASDTSSVGVAGVQQPASNASTVRAAAVAQATAVATIAQVASVARVASVAQPARVAATAAPESTETTETTTSVRPAARGVTPAAVDGDARAIVRAALRRSARDGAESQEHDGRGGEEAARLDALATALGARGARGGAAFGEGLAAAQGLTRSDAASRVERVLAAQDLAKGRPLHELTLALDGSDAGVESVRIGVTGRTVGATFEASDDASAARIGARLDELTRALERAGLEPEALRVRGAESRDALREVAKEAAGREAARAATVQVAESSRSTGTQTDQRQSSQRERDAWAQQDDRGQQGRGRNRSRREQQETTE